MVKSTQNAEASAYQTTNICFDLQFPPTINTISSTRRFVASLCASVAADEDLGSRVGLAVHELLENALKYSFDGRVRMSIDIGGADDTLRITTVNEIAPERREGLDEFFAELDEATDPSEFYTAAMVKSRIRRHGSGLGLARIWAESEMTLKHEHEDGKVTISAIAMLPTTMRTHLNAVGVDGAAGVGADA